MLITGWGTRRPEEGRRAGRRERARRARGEAEAGPQSRGETNDSTLFSSRDRYLLEPTEWSLLCRRALVFISHEGGVSLEGISSLRKETPVSACVPPPYADTARGAACEPGRRSSLDTESACTLSSDSQPAEWREGNSCCSESTRSTCSVTATWTN